MQLVRSVINRFISLFLLLMWFGTVAQAAELQTVAVIPIVAPQERTIDGLIEAVHQATISAQTSGRITKIHVDVDDYVNKGDVLIEFSGKGQRAAFNAARANLKQASAEHVRIQDIYAQKLVAKAMLDKAEAAHKSATARLEQAKEALEYTQVRAPYSGIVVKRYVEVGENARVGQKLMTGLSMESLRVRVAVPQDMIHGVRQHKQAYLLYKDGLRVAAESMRISAFADAESHSFGVQVYLPKGEYGVYPGMYAKVVFVLGEDETLAIPLPSVMYRSEVTAVYTVTDTQQIALRQVRLGKRFADGQIAVLAGLQAGEQVALDPVHAAILLKEQQDKQ